MMCVIHTHHENVSVPPFMPSGSSISTSSKGKVLTLYRLIKGFPGGSDSNESACNVGDLGLIPGLGRSLGGGCGNPLQYSCLESSMDRGTWQATVPGVRKNWTQLSDTPTPLFKLPLFSSLPANLLHPWDLPGRNTAVGCHASSRGSSRPRDQTCLQCCPRLQFTQW